MCNLITSSSSSSSGSLDVIIETCCDLGKQWYSESRVCKPYPSSIRGIPSTDQETCQSIIELCCLYKRRDEQCVRGKQIARVRNSCEGLHSQMGNEQIRVSVSWCSF